MYLNGTKIGTIAHVGQGTTLTLTAVTAPDVVTLPDGIVQDQATYTYVYAPAQNVEVQPSRNQQRACGNCLDRDGFQQLE